MADFVGRKLGLPAVTFNPATWGKVLHEQEPARLSVTTRTNDVVSVLETLFPGDRQVRSRRAKGAERLLVMPAIGVVCFLLGIFAARFGWLDFFESVAEADWLRRVGALACVLGLLGYYLANHPVTNFTVR